MGIVSLRAIFRRILGFFTVLTIKKHNPEIIVVTGNGQTSLAREYIYSLLYEKAPTRRNLEIPESEFSIPLTVFGEFTYPKNKLTWIPIILKVLILLIKNGSYKHTLILEVSDLDATSYNYWNNILKPKFIINVSEGTELTSKENLLPTLKKLLNELISYFKLDDSYFENQIAKTNFPSPRINFRKGKFGEFIIDARHYYYPPALNSAIELTTDLTGRKIIFTKDKSDLESLKNSNFLVNPINITLLKTDVVILRGIKTVDKFDI